jgi:hypothetical protein
LPDGHALESDKNGYHAPFECYIKLAAISCYSDTNSFIEKPSGKKRFDYRKFARKKRKHSGLGQLLR